MTATKKDKRFAKHAGLFPAALKSAGNYAENVQNTAPRGHGFAAERANHHIDQFFGKRPRLVGTDNARNGADRHVGGVPYQSKYCATGSRCISECFDGGQFRYRLEDGSLMQIEVPKDLYESAVQAMGERIRKGQVPGVTDPAEAKNIVRKGHVTYKQALRIAKAGSIEGLKYDAVRGIQLAGSAVGMSAAFAFATNIWNGEDIGEALKGATQTGLQVGGIAWVTSVATAQIGRTGLEQGLRSSTDFAVRQLGPKTTQLIANSLRSGPPIYGAAAGSYLSKVMRGNIVTAGVSVIVMSGVDTVKLMRGHMSGAQFVKNAVVTTGSTVAGTGAVLWLSTLAVATGPLGWLALATGGAVAGAVAGKVSKAAMDQMIRDDNAKLQQILEAVMAEEAEHFLLTAKEVGEVASGIPQRIQPHTRGILTAENPATYALTHVLLPLIEAVVAKRPRITPPDAAALLAIVEAQIADADTDGPPPFLNPSDYLRRFL